MKKLFFYILTAILFCGIGVAAGTQFLAKDVGFTPSKENQDKGWEVNNVEEALNDLYSKNDDKLYLYWYGETYDEVTGGWNKSIPVTLWGNGNSSSLNQTQATMNSNNMDFKISDTYQVRTINTVNKIDCQNYDYLNIVYSMNKSYNTIFRFSKDNSIENYAIPNSTSMFYSLIINHDRVLKTSYPISCSEPGYLMINTLRGITSDETSDLIVYGIYLSKK